MKSVRVVYDNNELKLFVKDVRYLNGLVCVKMYLDVTCDCTSDLQGTIKTKCSSSF